MLRLPRSSHLSIWLVFVFSLTLSFIVGAEPGKTDPLLETVCPDPELSTARRIPGPSSPLLQYDPPTCNPDQIATPSTEHFNALTPVADRWRIVEALGYPDNWLDPYHGNNPLKGDRPVFGKDWFISLNATSNSILEPRYLPIVSQNPNPSTGLATSLNTGNELFFNQNFILDTVIYKGDTVFRPPDFQFRFTPVINYNQTSGDSHSQESLFAVQALYIEKYLRDASDHYDFDSIRVGIQPFTSDFRGFLLLDQQFGVRLFGTRNNNIFQYNVAWLRRFFKNKATLNDLGEGLAENDVFLANLYWQDLFKLGFNSQFLVAYNRSREAGTRIIRDNSTNGNPVSFKNNAQHDYDVIYLGYNGDGHFGLINLTGSTYYALGKESGSLFVDSDTNVRAFFIAGEISVDFDWFRLRFSGMHASGDDDPYDDTAQGFDGIFQNPIFAGANSNFFIHQALPLIGNKIGLKRKNSFFNSMRSRNDPGQSNFTNPGVNLIGIGADFDLMPELRISLEANQVWFDETAVLEATLGKPNIASSLGQDLSITAMYRPFVNQNLIFQLSASTLLPAEGYRDIYDDKTPYSIFANIVLSY